MARCILTENRKGLEGSSIHNTAPKHFPVIRLLVPFFVGAGVLKVLLALALFLGTELKGPSATASATPDNNPEVTESATFAFQDAGGPDAGPPLQPKTVQMLQARLRNVAEHEAALQKEFQDLALLRQDIDERLQELKRLQAKLEGPAKKAQSESEARFQHLVGVYNSMEPERAATLLNKMDEDTVAYLFEAMKSKKAAQILALMEPDKAARISSTLSRRGLRP